MNTVKLASMGGSGKAARVAALREWQHWKPSATALRQQIAERN